MPTVPTLSQPQVQPPRIPGVQLDERVPDTGSGIASGLDVLGQVLQQQRERNDRTAVQSAETQREQWANTALYDPNTGAFNREGKNALGVTNDVLADYDKQTAQIAGTLTGQRQQEAYAQSSRQQRVALQGQLARFEFAQRSKYEDETADARVSTAIQTGALNYNDPTILGQSRQAITDTLASQKAAKGWDDTQLQAATNTQLSALHENVIDRMIADDKLTQARTYLGVVKPELKAEEQLKLTRAIDTAEREKRNEMAAAVRQQVEDLSASYKAGLPVPSGQELPLSTLELVFPGKGREMYDSLQADKRMGFDLKDLNQQDPKQVISTLSKYIVTQGGAGAADAEKRQTEVTRAAQQSMEARQKNPAQFVIDNNLGYTPLTSDPKALQRELQNREAIRGQVSQQVGTPVPMLTPDESKALGGKLAQSDPQTAVETFSFLRNTVGDQAYQNIMQQIAPDSPVKAYAGQIYGRPTPVTLQTHLFSPDETASPRIVAQTLVQGEDLINKGKAGKGADGKPGPDLFLPNRNQFDAAFAQSVGDTFAGRPDAESLAQQVAYAYYTGKSAQTGRLNADTQDIDTKLVGESLRAAVGNVVNFHGYGHVLAPLGMDESSFNDKANAAFTAELKARGVPADQITQAQSHFGSLGLRNWKADQYMVTQGRDLFSLKGEPIVITVGP